MMVGFDKELYQIIDILVRCEPNFQVIPIVGMGGSGKTILAKNVYKSKLILHHFDSLAWVTISQEYNVREILFEILSCLEKENEMNLRKENENGTAEELGEKLHKSLWRRRYLIVMDDMWDMNVWDKVSRYFPKDNSGSRVIVTTRDSNMSAQFSSLQIKMNFLNENKSWNLFCQKAFPQGVCPLEYEGIGKRIARSCKGLPLSIVVIGGLLRKSEGKREYWEYVANDVNSNISLGDDERCIKILSLSYHHLPIHLKPCFLYVGIYPEDAYIRVSKLVNFWIVEGFLKQNGTKNLEEVGKGYLKDLISRNLILVHERGRTGNVRLCKIHDVLRDLCLREAQKEKFIYIPDVHGLDSQQGLISRKCLFPISTGSQFGIPEHWKVNLAPESTSRACSSICDLNCTWPVDSFKLLRKLEILGDMFDHRDYKGTGSFDDISQLINSRYLLLTIMTELDPFKLYSSMSLLWNLQILIFDVAELILSGFWEMSQLRHLEAHESLYLPHPPIGQKDVIVLKNLQTLYGIANFKFSEEAVKRIPNIIRLELRYDYNCEAAEEYCLQNIGLLQNLESLRFRPPFGNSFSFQLTAFPTSLKKLYLVSCYLDWKNITTIGSLPHLEMLVLDCCFFEGLQSETCDEQFQQLKYLRIDTCCGGFINGEWRINETYFPCLEHLILSNFNKEILISDIGDISMLHTIKLLQCSPKIVLSAKKMQEEQEKNGNDGLVIRVKLRPEDYKKENLLSLKSTNFRIYKNFVKPRKSTNFRIYNRSMGILFDDF